MDDDDGLKLLKEFVEEGARNHDAPFCGWCGRCLGRREPHRPDCLWFRARAYLRDQGVEVKDGES